MLFCLQGEYRLRCVQMQWGGNDHSVHGIAHLFEPREKARYFKLAPLPPHLTGLISQNAASSTDAPPRCPEINAPPRCPAIPTRILRLDIKFKVFPGDNQTIIKLHFVKCRPAGFPVYRVPAFALALPSGMFPANPPVV